MPELPEVERTRLILNSHLLGLTVERVSIRRADVVDDRNTTLGRRAALLLNGCFLATHRRGKRLALETHDGRVLEVGFGMTGQLLYREHGQPTEKLPHCHVRWTLHTQTGRPAGQLVWRDPRRFGGLVPWDTLQSLQNGYWWSLGPDALEIGPTDLNQRLRATSRAIKVALLDQRVLAGLGNIYVDEALFRAKIDPSSPADQVPSAQIATLHRVIKPLLAQAIEAGGSTIQDYVDPTQERGSFQASHAVYGRSGECCLDCSEEIQQTTLGGRTTHWCPTCQELF